MKKIGHNRKKFIWVVVDNHNVEETTDHYDIGLRGFDFNFLNEDEKGEGREGYSNFPYLLILIQLWPGYWETQLKKINNKLDE